MAESLIFDITKAFDRYEADIAKATRTVASFAGLSNNVGHLIQNATSEGARFMRDDDLQTSDTLTFTKTPSSVLLGYSTDSNKPVYFNGHESILSVGGPGSMKTQSQVIPNLLTYPGSAIVLDVKGELWDTTAAHRKATFGPVYRFAPTDPQGRTHRFNPFDYISNDPAKAATDCEIFGYQIIAENPRLHDPYWENKGRDFLWAYATVLALAAPHPSRRMEKLAELASLPLSLTDPGDPTSIHPNTASFIKTLKSLSKSCDIPDLAQAATTMETGIATGTSRLDSTIDTTRRYLSQFSRSRLPRAAMASSDWSPLDLRRKRGTTIYMCIPDTDLKAFAPIIRLIFFQHLLLLKPYRADPKEPPITFFLDEMPALGNFQSIVTLQNTGRSAGLRLWMFAQHLGQLREAYGTEQGNALIGAARVRSYLRADERTAHDISKDLGSAKNFLTGQSKSLAEVHELMGPKFANLALTIAAGEHPLQLKKRKAVDYMKHLMKPPPVVPKII